MDLSQIPIHQRLDALLERLDNSGDEDNVDYLDFVDRRAQSKATDSQLGTQVDDALSDYDEPNREFPPDENRNNSFLLVDHHNDDENSDAESLHSPTATSPARVEATEINHEIRDPNNEQRIEKQHRRTAKQVQLEIERAARENQELERMCGDDISTHTTKSRTVNSFLASLSDDEDQNTNDFSENDKLKSNKLEEEHRFKELVSSPPKMQGLRSFVAHKASQHGDDSDSELEVIPETKTNRLSRPVKDLLKFSGGGGGTPSDHKLAQERAKLLKLQRQQIAERRKARIAQLKENGVDVEGLVQTLASRRQQNAMSAQNFLEQERQRADMLRVAEYSGSDSESDLEFEGSRRGRKVLSDSEGEEEPTTRAEASNEQLNTVADAKDVPTDEEDETHLIGRTGTQYVPPLSQDALAKILGESADDAESSQEEKISSSPSELLDIVQDEAEIPEAVQPDFSDLKRKDLTLSQHLSEVRQRYLEAQAEQRRKESLARRNKKKQNMKSMFVEDQAEESDDEENGGVRTAKVENEDEESDEEDQDKELQTLVDHNKVNVKETELRRQYLEEEKIRDQRILNKLVDGVNGGFRRRHKDVNGNQFLSDDDAGYEEDDSQEQMQQYLKAIEAQRKSNFVNQNVGLGKIANDSRAAAFFTSVSEDLVSRPVNNHKTSVQETLDFLRSVVDKDNQYLPDPQPSELNMQGMLNDDEKDDNNSHNYLPRPSLSLRRTSTVRIPQRVQKRGSTYASRISATDLGGAKTVEIMQSLGRSTETNNSKKQFVVPSKPPSRKRATLITTAPSKSGSALFKRNWT